MPERVMQADDPAALADPGRRMGQPDDPAPLRQVAGAVAALARRADQQDERLAAGLRPKATLADRSRALQQAREFVTELGLPPRYERVHAELAVARYLTGE